MSHGSLRIGEIDVDVVCEGFAPLELADEMPGVRVDWAAERERFPWAFHGDDAWPWHVHAFVLRTPEGAVMVDSGLGEFPPFRPWAESVDRDAALAVTGVVADEVTSVVLTHLHADHAGGVVVNGGPRFPNAVHHAHPSDWSFFGAPDRIDGFTARGPMAELERLRMLDLREEDHVVAGGVRVVHAPGHTPGHRAVIVESAGESLLLAGDLLHVPIQIARPEVRGNHDVDPDEASRSRLSLLTLARRGGWSVAVSHFARPFGRVAEDGWQA